MSALRAALAAELIKIRTVRSSWWTLGLTFLLCTGLAYVVGLAFDRSFDSLPADQQRTFDPLFATFYSVTIGQLALVTFGVLTVSTEYTSGSIRVSLAAMPRRALFLAAKVLAATLVVLAPSGATSLATFWAAQAGLGPHHAAFHSAVQAVVGSWLYLTMICAFAMGVATMLRSSIGALAALLPLLFLGSQGLGNVPKIKAVTQYLPDQAGAVIMHLVGPHGDPRFGRPYGPWTGMAILALWTGLALLGGLLVLRHRDA